MYREKPSAVRLSAGRDGHTMESERKMFVNLAVSIVAGLTAVLAADVAAAAKIEVGKKAPEFTLKNQDEKDVSLKDFRGKWVVLYFYPKDDTPGCTAEACDFRDNFRQLESLNAVVLGVSADSPESHRNFIKKYNLNLTLLSDPERKVMETYGAWGVKKAGGKETKSVTRSTVLIDPKGIIAHHWPNVTPKGHAEQVRQTLEKLQK